MQKFNKEEFIIKYNEIKNMILNANTSFEITELIKEEITSKKSIFLAFFSNIKSLPKEEIKEMGAFLNSSKKELLELANNKINDLADQELNDKLKKEVIDVGISSISPEIGYKNPLEIVLNEVDAIFSELGYDIVYGTEVESDEYNFQRLNLPQNHPARDMQDTFYISDKTLLRTHCTNVTAREISKMNEGDTVAIISTGNVYRRDDDDATHSHQFMQIDGFLIAPNISFANLKWTIKYFCERIFGKDTKIRLRPSFFPFTEPSVEVDVSCTNCENQGCKICKMSGWIEVLGAGMIDPNVYELCGKSKDLTGFAFGIGVERIAMLKYGIDDIRHFYTNDINFLKQFRNFR